jgi:hypothetical protein
MANEEGVQIEDVCREIRRTLTSEVLEGRMDSRQGLGFATRLMECQKSIHLCKPDAAKLVTSLRQDLAANIACRQLVERLWQATSFK